MLSDPPRTPNLPAVIPVHAVTIEDPISIFSNGHFQCKNGDYFSIKEIDDKVELEVKYHDCESISVTRFTKENWQKFVKEVQENLERS